MKKPITLKNKRGDAQSVIVFAVIVLMMIFIAPILLKVVISPLDKFSTSLSAVDASNKSSNAVTYTKNTFVGMFDWVIVFMLIFNIVVLMITAFFVDTHPIFLIIYIIAAFFLVIMAPTILTSIDTIWNMAQFSAGADNVTQYLPILGFLKDHFIAFILGIIIISGLMMFGKYKLGNAQTQGGNYY